MNIDIRIKLDLFEHPKLRKLRRRLGAEGVLGLLRLWLWAAANRPDGLLRGLDADDLELAAQWEGQPGELAAALCELRLLDFLPLEKEGGAALALPPSERGAAPAGVAFRIHDWCEHQPWASRTEERSRIARQAAKARWSGDDDEKAAKKRKDMNQICSNMLDASPSNAPRAKSREPRAEIPKPEALSETLRGQAGEAGQTGVMEGVLPAGQGAPSEREALPAEQLGRAGQTGVVEGVLPAAGAVVPALPAVSALSAFPAVPTFPAVPAGQGDSSERATLPAEQAGNALCSSPVPPAPAAPQGRAVLPAAGEAGQTGVVEREVLPAAGAFVSAERASLPAGQLGRAGQAVSSLPAGQGDSAGEALPTFPAGPTFPAVPAGQSDSAERATFSAEQAGNALCSSPVPPAPAAPQGRAVLPAAGEAGQTGVVEGVLPAAGAVVPALPAVSALSAFPEGPYVPAVPTGQGGSPERATLSAGVFPEASEAASAELLPPQGGAGQGLPAPRAARSEHGQGAAFPESGNNSASLPAGFRPPTFAEVELYCGQRGNGIDPRRFLDWCEARSWQAGGRPIRDWRALVRRWEQREREARPAPPRQDARPAGQRARAAPEAAPAFPESSPALPAFPETSPALPAFPETGPALPASPTLARPAGAALLRPSRPFPGLPSLETGMAAMKAASVHQALVRERDLMARMILNENRGLYARLSRDAQTSGAAQPALPPEWAHRR